MADSYLNKSGLSYFWDKIKTALGLKVNQSDFDAFSHKNRTLVPDTIIPDNADLQTTDYLVIGKYYVGNNTNAATLVNCPTGGKAFMMEVISPISSTIDNETTDTGVYRIRLITTYEGKRYIQKVNSSSTAGVYTYEGWKYLPNEGDVNNQIYANTNSKYGYVRITNYDASAGRWVKIASMSHHNRSNDNVNYTFQLDFVGSGNIQYRQSYVFGVGARMSNTALGSVAYEWLDSEKFHYSGAPNLGDLVKVTRKWVAGTSSADHYIYFEIWVNLNSGWKAYWLHPTISGYKNDYSQAVAFRRNSDEWTYAFTTGTSAQIGQSTYLTEGYVEVPIVDNRKAISYLDNYYTTRPSTADTTPTGRGGLFTFKVTSSMSGKPAAGDGHIIQLDWDNTGGYDSQIYVSNQSGRLYTRGQTTGTWGDWKEFIRNGDSATFNNIKLDRVNTYPHIGGDGTYLTFSVDGLWGQGHGSIALKSDSLYPSTTESGLLNLGESGRLWKNLYLSDNIHKGDYVLTLPNKTGTVALTSDIPTKVSDIENDLNFVEDDTTQICNEGSILSVDNTTDSPLKVNKLSGNTEQATYSGKNLFAYIENVKSSESGVTGTLSADGTITYSGILSADNRHLTNDIDITDILEDGQAYTVSQTESFGDACSLEIRGRKTGTTTYSYWSTRTASGASSFTVNKTTYDEYKIWIIGKTSGTTGWGSTSRTLSAKYMLEKSSSASSWEPYVGGKASPSPEYPQSISTVTGRNVVEVKGKNVLDYVTTFLSGTYYGITATLNNDGSITISGKPTANYVNIVPVHDITDSLEDGATYALSASGNDDKFIGQIQRRPLDGGSIQYIDTISGNKTITIDKSANKYYAGIMTVTTANWGDNPLTITRTFQLEKGSAVTDFAPFSKQTYEINLGKNLLNKEDVVVGALLVDGTINSTNYPDCRTTGYIAVKPNTVYRVSGRTTWSVQGEYAKDKTFISRSTGDSFTTGPNTYYVRVVCVNSELGSMQFEAGSVATSFSDYFEPIELSGINEYIDYIWRDGEDFYIHREIGKYVFDGSETYARNGTHNFQTDTPFADYLKSSIEDDMAISDKFIYFANSGGSISTLLPDLNFAFSQDKTRAQFRYDAIASPADFKAWMEDNQLTVYYVLLNPTEEKITNEGLIEQLEALWYASGYNGQTNILVLPSSGNATGSISICQYPSHMPVATAYQLGNVIAGDGLNIEESGRISVNTSYVGNNITKISNSEIDIIMGVA